MKTVASGGWSIGGWVTVLSAALWLAGCQMQIFQEKTPPEITEYEETDNVGQGFDGPPAQTAYSDRRQHSFNTVGSDFDPDISLDSKWLVFASTANSLRPDIYMKSTNGQALVRLTSDPADDIQPAFSPDGSKIAWASNCNGNWDIFVKSVKKGAGSVQITSSADDEIAPSWSPDGTKICFCARAFGEWKIWVYDFRSQSLTTIGAGLFPKWNPCRDPKDEHYNTIVFQRPRERDEGWFQLWLIDADGGNPMRIVASNSWGAVKPSWRKDGKKIVFSTVHKSVQAQMEHRVMRGDDIAVIDPNGQNLTNITDSLRADWNPVWGADGRIYFSSDENGYKNIWSVRPWVLDVEELVFPAGGEDGVSDGNASSDLPNPFDD